MSYGNETLGRWSRLAMTAVLTAALAACGGGGGGGGTALSGTGSGTNSSGGSSTSGSSGSAGSGSTTASATLALSLVSSSGAAVPSNSISGSAAYVRVLLTDATGAVVPSRLVTFSTDATVATLAQATVLTDTSGVALVRITPVSSTSAAAGTVTASATVSSTSVQSTIDFQTSAGSVVLSALTPSANTITALQTAAVTVNAAIGSSAATAGQVSVNFNASCGSFSPSTASSTSSGNVSSVYQSAASCSGPVTLTAQSGSATTSAILTVNPAQAANLLFSRTDQTTIFTSRANSGVKQATLTFQVVDASGAGMAGQGINFSLSSSAISAGVTFSNSSASTTDASGNATVTVTAGSLPTPVVVTATLASNTAMQASSSGLAVTSGVPTQDAASLSAATLALEAYNTDGVTNAISFRIADRQGNPVPVGTTVTFFASHGQITGSCSLNSSSACTVTYTSQGTRPTNGRVVLLAYLEGEENFIDVNGNNSWDSGESFSDTGTVYRDDNENGVHESTEQTYPGGSTASGTCVSSRVDTPFIANTCDGTWSQSIRVRRQMSIVLASGGANIALLSNPARTVSELTVQVSDGRGNSAATGSRVTATVDGTSTCSVTSVSPPTVSNTTAPTNHAVLLNGDAACASASIRVTVTSPAGVASSKSF